MTSSTNNFINILDNWKYVLPPSRPSSLELQRISLFLSNYDHQSPIAVLGSTVEYRDLLKSLGFVNIFVLDKNRDFYEQTNQWCAYHTTHEEFIEGDWLNTLCNYSDAFDIILSDLTMGNLEYNNRTNFYALINRALKNNGTFIDKVLTNELPLIPLSHIQEKYTQLPLNIITANYFNCEALFCSELLRYGCVDTTKFYSDLRNKFDGIPLLMKLIELCHLITPEDCVWYYGRDWNTLVNNYLDSFSHSTSYLDSPGSPYYGRLKHFFNKKG